MRPLYNTGIYLYYLAASVAALFNRKAALFISGRKGLVKSLEEKLKDRGDRNTAWFHCSSVGEFEQARPVIEKLRRDYPQTFIFLTFFSPSGYELRKNYDVADAVAYLPMDTRRNVRRFLDIVRPSVAVFVKYEFWYNYLISLRKSGVPTYIISAIFRPDQIFFKWYGAFMREALRCYNLLFVQNEESSRLLAGLGIDNVVIAGDTRFDRVKEICDTNNVRNEVVETFAGDRMTWVAGSTWDGDEAVICGALKGLSDNRLVLVPHEVGPQRISDIQRRFSEYSVVLYSECEGKDVEEYRRKVQEADILVIDCVGILSKIYKYGSFAYIGGGFNPSGIHNILEAATYGCPVVFGPHYSKFQEARDLVALGGAFSVTSSGQLHPILEKWTGVPDALSVPSKVCTDYIESHLGASDMIMERIFKNR
ncbi:MAG TPA: 3-deoxy-D-manno-octulosonic acid transferase [Candidatus Coprenecus stercoravium]|uniref:3-deoxy-D-manno-octulosonic acid transferase n=1 Tax=Candidatus Coprenecus stercoravium TaxID=2840735 RepID=A0A9D2GNB7_9BACT|nr:3-deoxy-D-manno-octulosonic acid transferase [Candidatus Coprenecus stercoravium]